MRNIFVRTPKGVVVAYGDLFTNTKDSFGRSVFEGDRVEVEYTTEFGSKITGTAKFEFVPECSGFHLVPDNENLTELLNCDITDIIKVIDEDKEKDKDTEDKNTGDKSVE